MGCRPSALCVKGRVVRGDAPVVGSGRASSQKWSASSLRADIDRKHAADPDDASARMFQHIQPKRQYCTKPEGVSCMVNVSIACFGMDQDRQARAVQHEPGEDCWQPIRLKHDLEHSLRVWPNRLIMPAPKSGVGENGGHSVSQQRCTIAAARRVVIYVGVIPRNFLRTMEGGIGPGIRQVGHGTP